MAEVVGPRGVLVVVAQGVDVVGDSGPDLVDVITLGFLDCAHPNHRLERIAPQVSPRTRKGQDCPWRSHSTRNAEGWVSLLGWRN